MISNGIMSKQSRTIEVLWLQVQKQKEMRNGPKQAGEEWFMQKVKDEMEPISISMTRKR
jgi:hypothetical protein